MKIEKPNTRTIFLLSTIILWATFAIIGYYGINVYPYNSSTTILTIGIIGGIIDSIVVVVALIYKLTENIK